GSGHNPSSGEAAQVGDFWKDVPPRFDGGVSAGSTRRRPRTYRRYRPAAAAGEPSTPVCSCPQGARGARGPHRLLDRQAGRRSAPAQQPVRFRPFREAAVFSFSSHSGGNTGRPLAAHGPPPRHPDPPSPSADQTATKGGVKSSTCNVAGERDPRADRCPIYTRISRPTPAPVRPSMSARSAPSPCVDRQYHYLPYATPACPLPPPRCLRL
ncbi:hypothetical protein BZA05DRAFT_463524, partial [Tricharina praecox]|uniref:uncharacterized protein n=1 Tax=Tricharina praecox TaxID=43433 RepID=UPI0022200C40